MFQAISAARSASAAPNRNLILAVGSITGMGCGAIYMWSIFNKPLMELYGYSTSEVSLAYSLFMLASCVSGWLAGWLQQRMESRFIVMGAGAVFGAGWFLSGFADSLLLLYLCFGGLAGAGNGLLYNTIVSVVIKWFPDKRGFANGVCIGTLGLAPLLFAPAGNLLIEAFDVQTAFRIVGIVWLAVYLGLSWMLRTPAPGWAPSGADAGEAEPQATLEGDGCAAGGKGIGAAEVAESAEGAKRSAATHTAGRVRAAQAEVTGAELGVRELFRQPLYYALFVALMLASASGLMVTGHASTIGQEMANLTAAEGAFLVGAMAVGNFAGRFGFGFLSDYLGRYNTLIIVLALNAAVMLLFLGNARTFAEFVVAMSLVGACFGATMTIVPAVVGDAFGSSNFGQNYSFVYPGYTVAAFAGPMLAAIVVEASGTYVPAFWVAGGISLVGIALVLLCKRLVLRVGR